MRVICVDEPANAVLGAGDPDDHFVLHHERRDGGRIAGFVIGQLHIEQHAAGFHIECNQVRVQSRHEEAIAEHTEAAVDCAAAELQILGELATVAPDLTSRSSVDRPRVVVESSDIQHAVDHDRRGLKAAEGAGLKRPLRRQPVDVRRRDLGKRAVPLPGVITGIRQPAPWILQSIEQILWRHA